MKLELSSPNYETQVIRLRRVVRMDAWLRSFALGLFTYYIPFLFDYPNPNFYKLQRNSKLIQVNFRYSREYAHQEFLSAQSSGDLNRIKSWITKFNGYEDWNKAVDLRDEMELSRAIEEESEVAIDEYIRLHPQAKNLQQARTIKADMAQAREAFAFASKMNTVEAYTDFLQKFPMSVHLNDARRKLVDVAEKKAIASNRLDQMESYVINQLIPYSSYLSKDVVETKRNYILKAMDAQLINEFLPPTSAGTYRNLSSYWKRYMSIKNNAPEFTDGAFPKADGMKTVVYKIVFDQLKSIRDAREQNEFLSRITTDFPEIYGSSDQSKLVYSIINKTPSASGSVKLYGTNYLADHLASFNPSLGKFNRYEYKGENFEALANVSSEELEFSNGQLTGTNKAYIGPKPAFSLTIQFGKPLEISYYQNGTIVKTVFFMDGTEAYAYEFERGKNISVAALDLKIEEGNAFFRKGDYDSAISIYESALNNSYPSTLAQNLTLNTKLETTRKKRDDYLAIKKREEERGKYCGIRLYKPDLDFTYVDNRKLCKCCGSKLGDRLRSIADIQRDKAFCEMTFMEGYLKKHWEGTRADSAHIKGDRRVMLEHCNNHYGSIVADHVFSEEEWIYGIGTDRTYWPIDKYETFYGEYCSPACKNKTPCGVR